MPHNESTDSTSGDARQSGAGSRWRVLGWVVVGILFGVALAVLFLAYGQPELLLDQMNLRYCG